MKELVISWTEVQTLTMHLRKTNGRFRALKIRTTILGDFNYKSL
jgi:hypothetical protein